MGETKETKMNSMIPGLHNWHYGNYLEVKYES